MKRYLKKMQGATLLEVMLVLAIAAMIIVMSIRYYQTAQQNQQANAFVSQVNAIVAAADSMATATGSYTAASVNSSTLGAMLPSGSLTTPWGTTISVTAAASTITLGISSAPPNVCTLAREKIRANKKFTTVTATTCASIVYDATK